jgi:5-methylthioadenosine/S-adenosylhomocysteine deaminase
VGADSYVGSIEPGKRADLVVRKAGAPEHLGNDHALEMGVIAGPDTIAAVIVDGRIVVQRGELQTGDEAAIIARAHESARRLWKRVSEMRAR